MSVSDAALKAMKELGLTEYETAAYLALVEGGQMSASDVSTKSQVPYSRIYDVLGRLEEKGFIQVQKGRPAMYSAKAPTEVVRLVKISVADRIDQASKTIVEEIQPLFERETVATTRDVWLLHGRAAILAKALEMLDIVREEVLASVPVLDSVDDDLSDIFERILDIRADVKVLTSEIPETIKDLIPENFEVRTRETFGVGLVVDRRHTLIMLAGGEHGQELLGIYSSHAVFASIASTYFLSLWSDSRPL